MRNESCSSTEVFLYLEDKLKCHDYSIKVEDMEMRRSKTEAQSMIQALAVLLRNTTWKCGRVERLVVNYLRDQILRFGRGRTPVREMLQHFKFKGKQKSEFLDAIKRLEKRRIIKIEIF